MHSSKLPNETVGFRLIKNIYHGFDKPETLRYNYVVHQLRRNLSGIRLPVYKLSVFIIFIIIMLKTNLAVDNSRKFVCRCWVWMFQSCVNLMIGVMLMVMLFMYGSYISQWLIIHTEVCVASSTSAILNTWQTASDQGLRLCLCC